MAKPEGKELSILSLLTMSMKLLEVYLRVAARCSAAMKLVPVLVPPLIPKRFKTRIAAVDARSGTLMARSTTAGSKLKSSTLWRYIMSVNERVLKIQTSLQNLAMS